MSRYLVDQIERSPNVEILRHCEVRELIGQGVLEALVVVDTKTGESRRLEASALFVFIGAEPNSSWLGELLAVDDRGFLLTGGAAARVVREAQQGNSEWSPSLLETSSPGVFAVGDVRSGSVKRVASGVGEGSMAVHFIHGFLDGATGLARV
jgi:thioredoxin reductase (NADPH)